MFADVSELSEYTTYTLTAVCMSKHLEALMLMRGLLHIVVRGVAVYGLVEYGVVVVVVC